MDIDGSLERQPFMKVVIDEYLLKYRLSKNFYTILAKYCRSF